MNYYLYLTSPDWANAWISGGVVPFYQASRYKSDERKGTMTPDENLIDNSTLDIKSLFPSIKIEGNTTYCNFDNCLIDGKPLNGIVERYHEDGLVICTATKRSKYIARRLGKKACVRILDINKLKRLVEESTGVACKAGLCEYTASHERNHFLKSTYDDWQREYRLFWPGVDKVKVELPPGMASLEFII
ncbi:hypothetical protein [Pseudescherichia vulneris]|uniref:hypothetical protein n=1 Tax=Pseudescherichia vulneris TaxID=566 RepID=UPI0030C9A93F